MPLTARLRDLAHRMHPQAEGRALLAEAANEIDRLRELLERCKQREYNGFEPDNQSRLYHDICESLK